MEIKITTKNYKQEVLESEKPVLLFFEASSIRPCKMMSPIISQIAEEYEDVLKVGRINTEEEEELSIKFGVMSMPMFVVMKNGKVFSTTVGFQPKLSLERTLGLFELRFEHRNEASENTTENTGIS